MSQEKVIQLFKSIVLKKGQKTGDFSIKSLPNGVITNFEPTKFQQVLIKECFPARQIATLFSVQERSEKTMFELIEEQIGHYQDQSDVFELKGSQGKVITVQKINGITLEELTKKVHDILTANTPFKDVSDLKDIIDHFKIDFDINKVENNELRIALFDPEKDYFKDGDDAVRWMCYTATGSTLLIKSPEVIFALKNADISSTFMKNHSGVLAKVFNRHKKLILSQKRKHKTVVNRISRWSKKQHVPVVEAINKNYVRKAINNEIDASVLNKITVRDKLKFLNYLEFKALGSPTETFIIRNGKVHFKDNRKVWDKKDIDRVRKDVLNSLRNDLSHLKNEKILLDKTVDYGLPVSRKQSVGEYPFGTRITVDDEISSGIYWENEWGSNDLDLSTIDLSGQRVGWGQESGYSNNSGIKFSGDVTFAENGAMEFMTSKNKMYGLFVHIYSGLVGSKAEVVVGNHNSNDANARWIEKPVVRQEITLGSRGNIIGFVKDKTFIVFQGSLRNNHVSNNKDDAIVQRGLVNFWTVETLLLELEIDYDLNRDPNVEYTHDLTKEGFTYDKLETLLG